MGYHPWGHKESDTTKQLSMQIRIFWFSKTTRVPAGHDLIFQSQMLMPRVPEGMGHHQEGYILRG